MRGSIGTLSAVFIVIFSGCVTAPSATLEAASRNTYGFAIADQVGALSAPLHWQGANLTAPAQNDPTGALGLAGFATCLGGVQCDRPACTATSCERVPFTFDAGPDFWTTHDGALQVVVQGPIDGRGGVHVDVFDASGLVVGRGIDGWYGSVARIDHAPKGAYLAVVQERYGQATYDGALQVVSRPKGEAVHDLLPDLVTLPPTDLKIDDGGAADDQALQATGEKGCGYDEVAEHNAHRCLRLSNRVGNVGEGPLEVYLAADQGATAEAGSSHFMQRIYRSDGSFHDDPVGGATFHPIHGHFHYAGLAHYTVYAYDPVTKTRGDAVNTGKKSGFCFEDSGLLASGFNRTAPPTYSGAGCLDPVERAQWWMGIHPGWFDLYYWGLSDQYVDMTGAKDGTYILVSSANGEHTLKESDASDNDASVVFTLTGDAVKIVR